MCCQRIIAGPITSPFTIKALSRYKRVGTDAVILAVRRKHYMKLDPDRVVKMAGGPIAVIDCFGILDDDRIRRYFESGCEVKALGRGHVKTIKDQIRKE